jgi:hypothetical protein
MQRSRLTAPRKAPKNPGRRPDALAVEIGPESQTIHGRIE